MADPVDITECAVLLRITRANQEKLKEPDRDKYRLEWTRGTWRIAEKWRSKIEYAICVNKAYEVVEVYKVHGWDEAGTTRYVCRKNPGLSGKLEFRGEVESSEIGKKYRGGSVRHYYPGPQPARRYVGCRTCK